MVAVALVGVVMSKGAPWSFLLRFAGCVPSVDTAVMVAALSSVATVSCCRSVFRVRRSHRSDVATFADGQTVRRLGDGCRSVFLLGIGRRSCSLCLSVRFVIGGHCQLLPLSSVRLDCQLLPPLPVSW